MIRSSTASSRVLATLDGLSGAPTFGTIFILGASPSRQERVLSNTEKITVFYLVMYITSYSIRIVLLSRYVNIYGTMAPMSLYYWYRRIWHKNSMKLTIHSIIGTAYSPNVTKSCIQEDESTRWDVLNNFAALVLAGNYSKNYTSIQ